MTTADIFGRLALALGIGLLIGIERGWQDREGNPGSRAAGIRTHAVIALLGAVWALLSQLTGAVVLGLAALGFAGTFAFFEWREMRGAGSYSATGLAAGLLSFALGAYAVLGDRLAAGSAAVAATVILAERQLLHDFLSRLKWSELRAALLLLAMTVVLLPVMPDRPIDPWGALNPFQIWLMTIMVAAISYGGYIAVRLAGGRNGLLYAGAVGGLVSSTTVSWTFARLARTHPESEAEFAAGVIAAWAISVLRVFVIVAVLAPQLALALAAPLAGAFAIFCAGTALLYRRSGQITHPASLELQDPFEIFIILRFGAVLAAVMLATRLLAIAFGKPGLFALAFLSGLADVDPITLSMTGMAGHAAGETIAAATILIAVASNMLAKCLLAVMFGTARFAFRLAVIAAAGAACAGLAYAV